MHAKIGADKDMPSHFWVMTTARAESIVSLSQRHIMCPVVECPEKTWNTTVDAGRADFSALVRASKLSRQNLWGKICSRRIMAMGHYLLGRPWGVGLRKVKK